MYPRFPKPFILEVGRGKKRLGPGGEVKDMPYDPLDDVPHSVRVNLSSNVQPMDDNDGHLHPRTPQRSGRNPYPLHFSPVTDGSPDVHQHQHTSAPISSTWSIGHTAHPHNLLSHNQQIVDNSNDSREL